MIKCEEAGQLLQEICELTAQYSGFDHELRMTSKIAREYKAKKIELKKAAGRLREAHQRLDNQIKEHACRP